MDDVPKFQLLALTLLLLLVLELLFPKFQDEEELLLLELELEFELDPKLHDDPDEVLPLELVLLLAVHSVIERVDSEWIQWTEYHDQ